MNDIKDNPPSTLKSLRYHTPILGDWLVRIILALFFAFCAGAYCQNAWIELEKLRLTGFTLSTLSHGLAIFAVSLYSLTVACLYVVRFRPTNKFAGWWPCLSALLGGFLGMGLIAFKPSQDLPVTVQIVGSLLVLLGNGLTAYILTHLGRSFSILPESRKLVVQGPYKIIRHPLYLVEAIATIGALIHFWSWGAVLLVLAQFSFQFVRMHYEEKVLTGQFPEYKDYALRTARLIPGIY